MNFVTASIGTFSFPFSNNCFENVADDASCYRSTRILEVILNETKQKTNETIAFEANCTCL